MISSYQNIVVKIGSSTLMHMIENDTFANFADEVQNLAKSSKVTIVTSGAIATARKMLNIPKPVDIAQKQALSSIGQVQLMDTYLRVFQKYGIRIGQILVTKEDISNTVSLTNLKQTIEALRKLNAIPVINENDAISTEEINIGDNDTLSAHVAKAIDADLLVILTDVDGVFDSNPNTNPNAKIVEIGNSLNYEEFISQNSTDFGTGGIATKIKAGNLAVLFGCDAIITNGRQKNPLTGNKNKYTFFKSQL